MIRWPDGPTSSYADSTFQIGRKKADEDQLQPTVQNTLRKLSRLTKKNCLTADRRLGVSLSNLSLSDSSFNSPSLAPSETGTVYLNEHLSMKNAEIAREARILRKNNKIKATWTRNCKVFIQLNGSSPEQAKVIMTQYGLVMEGAIVI
ncbi:hypothetical protein DPX16_6578 [Anabarilius grahami]|uniref:Uncharacterized protein n=1 Tax=Anabarilius grahami TaxID=495550 RepID=A0A3N0XZU8_ANAGA|nr:hypothetical protein DPX16_6578 [Anabarilius grahami]